MVLYLTPGCFDKGGISRYGRYQITALRELLGAEAVRVHSLRARRAGDLEAPFQVEWTAGGRDPDRGGTAAQKLAFAGQALAEAVRRRPRLVVSAHVNFAGLAVAIARAVGARSVLDVYGLEVWSGLRRDAAWGLAAADLVIADCHFTASYVREARLRPPSAPLEVLWDCVDLARFHPGAPRAGVVERLGLPDPAGHVVVLTLGRMVASAAHKGYDRLLEAFARAAPAAPALRLVFAGEGALVEGLRARAATLGLADRVTFTGAVHEDDLAEVYRACHVFSLVSDRGRLRGEGIPLTPLEAAACGKPILVGDQDGSREAAADGVSGFVLDPFDLAAHAERLIRLARDPALRARLGEGALARIREHHDYAVFRRNLGRLLAALDTSRKGRLDGTVHPGVVTGDRRA